MTETISFILTTRWRIELTWWVCPLSGQYTVHLKFSKSAILPTPISALSLFLSHFESAFLTESSSPTHRTVYIILLANVFCLTCHCSWDYVRTSHSFKHRKMNSFAANACRHIELNSSTVSLTGRINNEYTGNFMKVSHSMPWVACATKKDRERREKKIFLKRRNMFVWNQLHCI